jgi:L-ascorbate metabolism protein UlaG (beta-lactamase superfamily)
MMTGTFGFVANRIAGKFWFAFSAAVMVAISCLVLPRNASAQMETSTCLAVADSQPVPPLWPAKLDRVAGDPPGVKITYVGHSAFRIETVQGISVVTDYNGVAGDGGPPDIVTMNHAHSSHYTPFPDPAIPHVLKGWESADGRRPAEYHLRLEDLYIRNVPTDLYVEGIMIEEAGNSIFIFETAGLCIGHLGHLHHSLTPEHIAVIGRLDILFMPVDGTYTMSQAGMIELAKQLRSSMVIPMHYFSAFSLQRFLVGMEGDFAIDITGERSITVSLATLPQTRTVVVLQPF